MSKSLHKRTLHLRDQQKYLFISHKTNFKQDIHKNTVSGWIRKLITECYQIAHKDVAELQGTSTHAIRGMAASLSFKWGADLEDVLEACSWASHTTFTEFYLKDISLSDNDKLSIGPLAVAQRVINV